MYGEYRRKVFMARQGAFSDEGIVCVWKISKESIHGKVHSVTRESCVYGEYRRKVFMARQGEVGDEEIVRIEK